MKVSILALGMGVGLVGGAAYLLSQKPNPTPTVGGEPLLRKGSHYRVWVRLQSAVGASARRVSEEVAKLGFAVLLCTPDPSAPLIFTCLCRRESNADGFPQVPGMSVFQVQEVETPSVPKASLYSAKAIDAGLTEDEFQIVKQALLNEMNPKHLGGMATTFEPDYPIVSSLLRAKSQLVVMRASGSVRLAELVAARDHVREAFIAEVEKRWKGEDAWRLVCPGQSLAQLQVASREFGEAAMDMWKENFGGVPELHCPFRAWVMREVFKTGASMPDENFLKFFHRFQGKNIEEKLQRVFRAFNPASMDFEQVRYAMSRVLAAPSTLRKYEDANAKTWGVTPDVAAAAMASVEELEAEVLLAHTQCFRLPAPSFANPSSLALASATLRPTLSTVLRPKEAIDRAKEIMKAADDGNAEAKKAKRQLVRAIKTLERQKWVSWYKKLQNQNSQVQAAGITGTDR